MAWHFFSSGLAGRASAARTRRVRCGWEQLSKPRLQNMQASQVQGPLGSAFEHCCLRCVKSSKDGVGNRKQKKSGRVRAFQVRQPSRFSGIDASRTGRGGVGFYQEMSRALSISPARSCLDTLDKCKQVSISSTPFLHFLGEGGLILGGLCKDCFVPADTSLAECAT